MQLITKSICKFIQINYVFCIQNSDMLPPSTAKPECKVQGSGDNHRVLINNKF